jgi:hypothetical protein
LDTVPRFSAERIGWVNAGLANGPVAGSPQSSEFQR